MSKPKPPPAPDYAAAAKEQGTANLDAAVASSNLNNPNVINPYGTQTYTPGATPSDRPTLTQTFSPEQQALYNQDNATSLKLGQLGQQGAESLQGVVGKSVDFGGLPAPAGSAEATRTKVIDAMMGRANEDYGKSTDQANSDLVAAGIRPGSKAYGDKMQMIERSRNDARQQAEVAGGNAAAQDFNMDNSRRQQAITEYLAQRQVPLNEITALMSGSQVSSPFTMPGYSQGTQVGAAPMWAATNALGDYNSDLYNVAATNAANRTNGLIGLAAGGIKAGASMYTGGKTG